MKLFTRLLFLVLIFCANENVLAQPTANFSATPIVGCAPLIVQFSDLSTGSPTSWSWNLGNSTTSVLQNPSTTYTVPGTYTVTLTVSNANGSNTKTLTNYITVYGAPIVNFTGADTAGCPPLTVHFTDASNPVTPGAAQYSWSFGDGNISNIQNPDNTYGASGYYNVTLIVTNSGGCVSSLTKPNYIHVYTPPVADFTAPTVYCNPPATVNFTSNITGSGPYTYNWDFGDATTGTGANPSHVYANNGAYTVKLIVTDAHGCKDTVIKQNYINVSTIDANFTAPSACVNTPLQFSNTSTGATSYAWDFGDATGSTNTNPAHIYTTAGTYNVRLVAFSGSCTDTLILPVTVNPQPTADFTASPLDPCPAPATIQFTNQSTNGVSYQWSFGDNTTSTATSPSHTYNANGWYTVTLIVTNQNGCKDTITKPQYIQVDNLVLETGAVPYQGCVPLTVDFTSARYTSFPYPFSSYPYGIATWTWDFGDGSPVSSDSTPTHIYTNPGNYTVTTTITTVNGCTTIDTLVIHVGSLPTALFTASPDTICMHQEVNFTNLSTGATAYIWDFGDGGATGAVNPTYTYANSSGTYTVILHAYNNGCEDTFMVQDMITVHPPTSKFYPIFDCDTPTLVRFIDTATIEATSRVWLFGDNTTSTATSPTHIYPALGNYTVSLITYNNIYGCTDTMTMTITLLNPTPTFVTPDTAICKDDSIVFNLTYPGVATMYTWKVGNIYFPDTTHDFGYAFHQTGIYTVAVLVRDVHLCWDTFTRTGYVLVAKPTPDFTANPTVGCTPLTVQFTDNSTDVPGTYMVSRYWDFGNGNTTTVTGSTVSNTYNNAGVYDVQLIVTDNVGCSDSLTKSDYIDARKPHAAFIVNDTTACIGQTLNFTNSSTGVVLTAQWNFGDNTTSTLFSPTHTYTQTGTYTVRLIVTDASGCKDTLTRTNYVNVTKPDAEFTMSDTLAICPPLNILFTNTSAGGSSYAWNFGNSSTSSLQNPSAIYTIPGQYDIRLIVTNTYGCKDTAYGHANVLGYAGGLSYTPLEGCAPLEVQFTANLTNVPSLVWDFSDGVTQPVSGTGTISHTYVTPGAYLPKLILSDGAGCLNSSDGVDTIKVDGVNAGFITTAPCVGTPIVLTDTSFSYFSPVTSWYWNINNGELISTTHNPTYSNATAGTYPVMLIATNAHGCKDTTYSNMTIYDLPIISAGADTIICVGDAAQLTGSGGVSYVWQPAATLSCTNCPDPSASPASPTDYSVVGTDIHGCENKDTVHIGTQTVTTSMVGDGGEICDDSTFQLLAYGAQVYQWKPAATLDNPNIANPIASPHTTTTYTVIAMEGSCAPDSHKVNVIVHPLPVVNAGSDQTIVAGNSVMLQATGSLIQSFLWSPAATLSCETCSNPTASPMVTTIYRVIGISTFGCKSADTVTVHVICDNNQLFIPNTFSPNGDGQNDVFFPRGHGLKEIRSFRVYNRWGEVVFERNNIQLNDEANGWDGRSKGVELTPDVYVYILEGICDTGNPIDWKGDVTLIR